mgnify:FL=1
MRKRILCTLLALGLLLAMLPVTAGAADVKELNLADGYIIIRPNEYVVSGSGLPEPQPAAEKYIISAKGALDTVYNISIGNSEGAPGIYHVTLKNLNVNCNNGPVLQIYENSTVYLTLEGSSQLNVQNENATAILLHSNSTLNISGGGQLTVNSRGSQVIVGQGDCEINISGEKTAVNVRTAAGSYGRNKQFAIWGSDYPSYDLKVSVTDGAELSAYGGIRCKELKLDDTASLWSQAWADNSDALDCANIEYRSDRGIYLYYYMPIEISMLRSFHVNASGKARKAVGDFNWTDCDWTLQDGVLSSEGAVLRRNVDSLAISDKELEGRLGSWALLNGQKRTITPPVTPKDPEGNLLQNLVGTGLFFVPDDFPFYDVDSDDWFYESAKSAWANELIDGVTARYYMPDNTLTVAQAVKLAAALHQKQSVGFVTLQNGGTHWYDNYVNYAVANSLIEAAYQSKSAEDMNKAVTRAEFVHILSKLLNAGTINTVNNIPDVKSGDAYADEIFAFYRAGILTGSDRLGTFHPESSLKRSEAAAILVRLYDATQRQYITLG